MRVLKTPDGDEVVVSINSDVRLYEDPVRLAGIDIYAHKTRSGTMYYYTHSWSKVQPAEYSLLTADDVRNRLIDLATLSGEGRLTDNEMKTAEHYFSGIFD